MEEIRSRGLKTLPYRVNQQNELEMDFVKLPLLENYFRDALSKGDEEEIWDLWDGILEKIDVLPSAVQYRENYFFFFPLIKQ